MSAPLPTASRYATHDASAYPGLWRGCVGAWCPSLGISGSRLHDYGQRMNWADLSFAPAGAYAVENGGYSFATSKGNIATSIANGPTGTHAISLWYRNGTTFTADQQYTPLVYWGGGSTGNMSSVILSTAAAAGGNGATQFGVGASQFGDSVGTRQNDNNWHHVCITVSGTTWSVYVDGAFRTSKTMITNTAAGPIYIGFANDAIWGTAIPTANAGWLDDLRIYSRLPHVNEIRLLATRRAIAYEPEYQPAYYMEPAAGGVTSRPYAYQSARMIGAGR
jgi:hypothetical protein